MRTPPRAAPALPERASWQSASSSWRPWIDPLGLGPSKARIREQPTRRARRARRDERRGCGHGVTIPSGARPGKNGSYPESNGPEVAPGPARLAPARYSLEAEADAGRNDIGVPGVARARRVRDRIERAAREHVATCTVPGDPGGEPPGNPNERLGADVRPRTSRLAIEDRSEAGAGRRRGEPLDRLGSPLHHQAAVHAEGWRQGIGGPGADLGAAVLVVADGHARVRDVQAGLEQGVVVVNAQRGELRAKVGPIARVRVQRLEVTDRAEGRVPGLVTRGVQGHRFEEQRAELVAGPDVEQPRVDIGGGLAAGNDAGVVSGSKSTANIDAWLLDVRAGYQLGPLLLEAMALYTTGNKARNTTLGTVRYFQPLDTDTSYGADFGPQLTALGVDYNNALLEAGLNIAYPGVAIGYDKYGRAQVGARATYALTPALSMYGGLVVQWTAQPIQRFATPTPGAGLTPVFNGQSGGTRSYVGTEPFVGVTWRFAPGIAWDSAGGYMFAGSALDAVSNPSGPRDARDAYILTTRVRFSF